MLVMLITKLLAWGLFLSHAKALRQMGTLHVASVEMFNKNRYIVL